MVVGWCCLGGWRAALAAEGKGCNAPKGSTSFLVTTLVSVQVSCVQANGPGNIPQELYDAADLALVMSRFTPDLVQLPFNALDDRLAVSGWLHRLKAVGVEIHARSAFLQGLLLMDPATLPDSNFEGIAFQPESECAQGKKNFFWTDDDAASGHALYRGTIPCGLLP